MHLPRWVVPVRMRRQASGFFRTHLHYHGNTTNRPRNGTPKPATESLCPTCSALNFTTILRNGIPTEDMIPLGSLVDIFRRADQCRFCHLISSLFRRRWHLDALPNVDLSGVDCSLYAANAGTLANPNLEDSQRCHRLIFDFSDRPKMVVNAVLEAPTDLSPEIQLLDEDAHKFGRAKEVHGRRMADIVDIHLVKTWITLCEREHGDACQSPWWRDKAAKIPPFVRLVDVKLMSLVRAPFECRYMALSYVWGTVGDSYWTTKANVDSRAQPAGLDISLLPATISDSIHLVQALGERYLWVDALCIIQDSSDDKNDQIGVMELIYSGALLTIFAVGGESAHAGLPGLTAGSRHLNQHIEIIQGLHLAVPLPSLMEAIPRTIWGKRGWALQEQLLSRRRLFFTKHQVYFECLKDVWCEDLVAESKTVQYSRHPMRYSGSGSHLLPRDLPVDSVETYTGIVGNYTRRHLTYPLDILHAITAFTNAMSKEHYLAGGSAKEVFRYGMHIWNLDRSLLWLPRSYSIPARRVIPNTGVAPWPSWAWAGWTGAVYYSASDQETSMTTWSIAGGSPTEYLVKNWYLVDDDRDLIRLEVEKPLSFKFLDANDLPSSRYLIPEGDVDKEHLEPLPPAGTLIFRTQCASFRVSKLEDISNVSDSKPLPHAVFNVLFDVRQSSVRVGRIILPFSTPSPTVLEFIVLSRVSGILGVYDESIYGNRYSGCMLHAMAVKRGVGDDVHVRERIGLGVIFEQAWLECGAETETILLG